MNDIAKENFLVQLNYWYAFFWQNEASEYAKGYYRGICKSIEIMGYDWERQENGKHSIFDYEG